MKDVYIYGIQGIAKLANEAIRCLNPERNIKGFIVTRAVKEDMLVSGKPVYSLVKLAGLTTDDEKENIEVYICTRSSMHFEIEESLEMFGFHHYVRFNPQRWSELVKLYFVKKDIFRPMATLPIGDDVPFVRIYVVKSHKDTPTNYSYSLNKFMTPIQAGADLVEFSLARIKDNVGENISKKNGTYCELSALYQIWKNGFICEERGKKCYYGFFHYRRRLNITEDDIKRIASNDVDVVMPYPYPYEPDIGSHHESSISAEIWSTTVKIIEDLYPDYAKDIPKILGGRYMYVCNIVFARGYVMDKWCKWMFSILEQVEKHVYPQKIENDRQLGYLGETLTAIYFLRNSENYTIVHTDFYELD